MATLIRFQDVYRDAIQSLFGTNPSAAEMTDAYRHAHLIGTSAIQTGGGTFFDIFAKKGRDEWAEVETLIKHFDQPDVTQSALVRGDFLFGYEPQPFDVVEGTIREYGKMGMNVLQNFHGLNDTRLLAGVAEAARIAREEDGSDIVAQGTICIEDNPNVKVDDCLRVAEELIALGHKGFYLKSASGVLRPDFTYELTEKLLENFDEEVGIHAHSTYGLAPVCYMAAIEAAAERGKPMTIDVQHPALSGATAHPSMLKMLNLIKNHPNEAVRENAPELNIDAIKADMDRLYGMRFQYRDFEADYDHDLLEAMLPARAAGGASSTLKSIPGLVDNLGRALEQRLRRPATWNDIQIAIYKKQAEIDADIGSPTQVTPYAANTTGQAAISLYNELLGKDRFASLYPGLTNYLVGKHGRVPETTDGDLIMQALEKSGLEEPITYVPSQDRDPVLNEAREQLIAAGIEEPSIRQCISATVLKDGVSHVVKCANGENTPQAPAELPNYAREAFVHKNKDGEVRPTIRDAVQAIGGHVKLQEIAERALHLRQIDDDLYEFPQGEKDLKAQWREGNLAKLAEFMEALPEKLSEAGFNRTQIMFIMDNDFNSVPMCIKDACDSKGKGLYDYMVAEVEAFKRRPKHDLSSDADLDGARLEDV